MSPPAGEGDTAVPGVVPVAPLSAAERRAVSANIPLAYAFSALHNLQLWMPVWIIYLTQQRGLSLTEVTFLETPYFLMMVLTEVPTGALADRFGRRLSLVLSSLLLAAAIFVFGIATNFPLIITSYLIWAVGATFKSGADAAFVYDSLKALGREADFPRVQGRQLAIGWAAVLAASLAGAPLAQATDLATPVLVSAGITVAAALVALMFREPPAGSGPRPSYLQTVGQGVGLAWRRPSVRYGVAFMALVGTVFYPLWFFTQPFLVRHGASIASLGLYMVPLRLMNIAGNMAAPQVSGSFGFWRVVYVTPLIAIGAAAVIGAWDSIYAFGALPLASFANSLRGLLLLDYLNRRIPSEMRATVLSTANLVSSLTVAAAAPAYGATADLVGLRASYAAAAVAALLLVPPLVLLWRRADQRESGPAAPSGTAPLPQ